MMTSADKPFVFRYAELASTNTEMKQLIPQHKLPEGAIVITDAQVQGRGQGTNSWESEAGKNLTFSLLLRPDFLEPHLQFYISKVTSLALIDTLQSLDIEAHIKWPNDIYINNKKVAGILIENSILGSQLDYCIVGIGLNVNQKVFQSNAPNPVSLKQEKGMTYDLDHVLTQLLTHFFERYAYLYEDRLPELDEAYFNALYRRDGVHTYEDTAGRFDASIKGVTQQGLLQLMDDDGNIREYAFKEVSFIF